MSEQPTVTPRLRAVMERAAVIAREHGISAVGIEHVVLAALEDGRALPTQVISQVADVDQLRYELEHILRSPQYRGQQ